METATVSNFEVCAPTRPDSRHIKTKKNIPFFIANWFYKRLNKNTSKILPMQIRLLLSLRFKWEAISDRTLTTAMV